jgi:hypothetical protein
VGLLFYSQRGRHIHTSERAFEARQNGFSAVKAGTSPQSLRPLLALLAVRDGVARRGLDGLARQGMERRSRAIARDRSSCVTADSPAPSRSGDSLLRWLRTMTS